MYIYVVMGSAGDAIWSICAYNDKNDAEKHALEARKRAKKIEKEAEKLGYDAMWHYLDGAMNEWDPDTRTDYLETEYYVIDVPTPALLKYQGHKVAYDK